MVNASATETSLRDFKPLTALSKQIFTWHTHIFIANIRMLAFIAVFGSQSDVTNNVYSRRISRHQKHRHLLIWRRVRFGHDHRNEKRGKAGIR